MKPRRFLVLFLCGLPFVAGAQQTLVQYLGLPPDASALAVASDASGNVFVAANVTEPSGVSEIRIIKADQHGNTLASLDLGTAGTVGGVAVGASGNVVIVGSGSATGFPLKAPLVSSVSSAQGAGFVVKIDSGLDNVLFSTLLGGTQGGGTNANAVAVDGAGNIYVAGSTGSSKFPVTAGAFQTSPPPASPPGNATYAFVAEISPDGQHFVFSTYFGNSGVMCTSSSGSSCVFLQPTTAATGIALDSAGNITIAGDTIANNLPVTPNVYGPQCGCGGSDSPGFAKVAGFIARFAPGGATLQWATYFPAGGFEFQANFNLSHLALDSGGDVVIAGSTPQTLTTSAGALQPSYPGSDLSAGFVAKLDATGEHLLFSTFFGGGQVGGVDVDSQGLIWITGSSAPQLLPVTQRPGLVALLGPVYVAALAADGSSVSYLIGAPLGGAGQALATGTNGSVLALGTASSLLVTTPAQGTSLTGIENAAASRVSNAVAPFELISLYGPGIGPAAPAGGQIVNGVLTNSLSGVQVLFDGNPAPLLYAGPTQINAIVPSALAGQNTTTMQIVTPSGTLQGPTFLVRPSAPGVFANFAAAATPAEAPAAVALNQDGSLNSANNPAAPGSIVSVWATGTGQSNTARSDGTIMNQNLGGMTLPVSVLWAAESGTGGESLQVLYAGDAPGAVAGVVQVNFELPDAAPDTAIFELQVGEAISQSFSLYVQ